MSDSSRHVQSLLVEDLARLSTRRDLTYRVAAWREYADLWRARTYVWMARTEDAEAQLQRENIRMTEMLVNAESERDEYAQRIRELEHRSSRNGEKSSR